jgi:hypothetical protein
MPSTEVPADLLYSVKNAVAVELKRPAPEPLYIFSNSFREWLQYRLMPVGVATVISIFLTVSLLMTLLSTREATQEGVEKAQMETGRETILVAANRNSRVAPLDFPESPELNLPISLESPRINPTGALLALSKSIVRGKMKDEDVTIVADVFGNGLARIAEVVEAPRDRRAMQDLERALNEDRSDAPFVPANQDRRSDVVRVVLKIQRVDVLEERNQNDTKKPNR